MHLHLQARPAREVGMALVAATGIVHLHEYAMPGAAEPYLSLLFLTNGFFAAIALVGLALRSREWGWILGLIVTGGAAVAYLLSRTTGLPGMRAAPLTPIGIVSLVVEGGFVALAIPVVLRFHRPGGAAYRRVPRNVQ